MNLFRSRVTSEIVIFRSRVCFRFFGTESRNSIVESFHVRKKYAWRKERVEFSSFEAFFLRKSSLKILEFNSVSCKSEVLNTIFLSPKKLNILNFLIYTYLKFSSANHFPFINPKLSKFECTVSARFQFCFGNKVLNKRETLFFPSDFFFT